MVQIFNETSFLVVRCFTSSSHNSIHLSNWKLFAFETNYDYVIKFYFWNCIFSRLQSLEKFSVQTTLVAHHLEAFMRQIHDTEFPNSVEATKQLLIEQETQYIKLKVKLE